jgi:hypothetical protein
MLSVHSKTAAAIALLLGFASVHANDRQLQGVPNANPKLPGISVPDILSPELRQSAVAEGSVRVENPQGNFEFYGFSGDGPHTPAPGALPAPGRLVEATKTEPDKNGADGGYRYGGHFLFQGHENAAGGNGYITRINLDADGEHRVTVLASADSQGAPLPLIDGSTWYPWSGRLLFTSEGNGTTSGGVWQATPDFPSSVNDLLGIIGRGGFEGIQADSDGNLWIVEDIGGATVSGARVPNSFLYRFIPKNKRNLAAGGKLQALQVMKLDRSGPIVFNSASALTQDVKDLHTYGNVFETKWVTIHDTDIDGTIAFNANALAKAIGATPFKRPENGLFRPRTGFRQFFFDETGDTSAASTANNGFGGFGSVMKLTQIDPSASSGKLTLFFNCDLAHAAFDNVAFWDANHVVFVEDRGDGLHTQGNALDSGWMFDVRKDYSHPTNEPVRILAEGRDALATIDSGFQGQSGFQNDGDNEITGIHVSNGDPGVDGLLGAQLPHPFTDGWRVFYTQQHGENVTWEILPSNSFEDDDRR